MSWRLFFGASILGAALALHVGAPLASVVAGVALAAWLSRLRFGAGDPEGKSR